MLKLTIRTPERRHWRRSGVVIVNFEQANTGWVIYTGKSFLILICPACRSLLRF